MPIAFIDRPLRITTEQFLGHTVTRPIKMAQVEQEIADQVACTPNVCAYQLLEGGYRVRLIPYPSREYTQAQYEQDMRHPATVPLEQQQVFAALPAEYLLDENAA